MHSPSESNKKSDEGRRRSDIYDYFDLKNNKDPFTICKKRVSIKRG